MAARFHPHSPTPDHAIDTYALTEDGYLVALADADRLSYSPEERRETRREWGGTRLGIRPIVMEVRSMYKIIDSYPGVDESEDKLSVNRDEQSQA